jgi:DNA repair exonuclease SbcCD ATPase subunit
MLNIKSITAKNFMSVGNVTQGVTLNENGLTLVLGNNMDLGGDGSRNGTGKTTIVNALSYALYGNALYNIKKDNLVNKTNNKQMLVTVDFEKDGISYRIERGRKPNVFKFLVGGIDNAEGITDEMQGEGKLTQHAIEKVLGMSHTMFKHILALNTYTEPFLSMRANEARELIEQLLGITQLSEKADILKELIKQNKEAITNETARITATEEANKAINNSIADMERRRKIWAKNKQDSIDTIAQEIILLEKLDVDAEIQAHSDFDEFNIKKTQLDTLSTEVAKLITSIEREQNRLSKAETDYEKSASALTKTIEKITKELAELDEATCYACGGELHADKKKEIEDKKTTDLESARAQLATLKTEFDESISEYNDHITEQQKLLQDYKAAIAEMGDLGSAPKTYYNTVKEAYEHQNKLSTLQVSLQHKIDEDDPYVEQIESLKETGLQDVDWSVVNDLTEVKEHQDFLYKLLTNKDSFVRKRIIEQNLAFMNNRLEHYITKLGLPHEVQFQSDLSVTITQLGQDLDFDNLSRGERNRLILGLSWAFRDVFESMNHPINLVCIDELVDSGMDSIGVENALSALKKMERERNKNILLISHRDELVGRVNNVLQVTKENGFTTFNTEIEVIDA